MALAASRLFRWPVGLGSRRSVATTAGARQQAAPAGAPAPAGSAAAKSSSFTSDYGTDDGSRAGSARRPLLIWTPAGVAVTFAGPRPDWRKVAVGTVLGLGFWVGSLSLAGNYQRSEAPFVRNVVFMLRHDAEVHELLGGPVRAGFWYRGTFNDLKVRRARRTSTGRGCAWRRTLMQVRGWAMCPVLACEQGIAKLDFTLNGSQGMRANTA